MKMNSGQSLYHELIYSPDDGYYYWEIQWFLFKLVNGEWEYNGFYPTMKAAIARMRGQ